MSTPSNLTPVELAAMISAKLCHDLISPTSAIVSGVDLLEDPDSQDMREDAIGLITASARKLGALLSFCRVAFGASAAADTFDTRDLKALTEGVYQTYKADLDWAVTPDALPKPAARALLNLSQIIAQTLPRGGTARLAAELEGEGLVLTASAAGLRAKMRAEVGLGLAGEAMNEGLHGHWVQAYYLHLIVSEAGGSITHATGEETVEITMRIPV